jgi:pSer/pThr/pTyr-binding forkhead associated (FHA) protein
MPDKTVERTTRRDAPDAAGGGSGRPVDQLFLVLEGARPLGGGARWSLEGLDEVRVRRGSSRASARERDGARNVLSIKLPDALLSSSHGRLVRSAGGWTLVDDKSTNGTLIDG